MDYLGWNDLLASHFFNTARAGSRVWLEVTEDLIRDLGKDFGIGVAAFVSAVKQGPPWVRRSGICQRAFETYAGWRRRNLIFPPYIAYLGLFVLAADIEADDLREDAYYPRLNKLLNENIPRPPRGFHKMFELWEDLEKWSVKENLGRLGDFFIDFASNWIHVGLPVAQTILTSVEKRHLPTIFADSGLDADSNPTDQDLAQAILSSGRQLLRMRTLRILSRDGSDQDLRNILVLRIQDELKNWDSTIELSSEDFPKTFILGSARLCINRLDRVKGTVTIGLRCYCSRHDIPENGLNLRSNTQPALLLQCKEENLGWTEPLRINDKFFELNDFSFLLSGLKFTETDSYWQFQLPPNPVRIFVDASSLGFPGYIEERKPPTNQGFLLLVHSTLHSGFEKWGREGCRGFKKIEIRNGLPSDWGLYEIISIQSEVGIREIAPNLSTIGENPIELIGGFRLGKGNTFFKFAPPKIRITSNVKIVEITPDSVSLKPEKDGLYTITGDLGRGEVVSIRVTTQTGQNAKRNFSLIDDFPLTMTQATRFGRFGQRVATNEIPNCCGGYYDGCEELDLKYVFLIGRESRFLFLGRSPGQVFRGIPPQSLPWTPIWVIDIHGRRATALFCGNLENDCSPIKQTGGHKSDVLLWREFLWIKRKIIHPPQHPKLKALWNAYLQVAKNA